MSQLIEHPFEDIFNIESGSTEIDDTVVLQGELVTYEAYDLKDQELDHQFQFVFDNAIHSYKTTVQSVERGSDPGNSHKNLEVANQFLSTALSAIKEKADMKYKKDKSRASNTNITNNNLIMDRDALLAMIAGPK